MAKLPNEASSEVTPEAHYLRRREFIKNAVLFTGTTAAVGGGLLWVMSGGHSDPPEPPSAPQGILGTAPPLPKPEANDGSLARGPYTSPIRRRTQARCARGPGRCPSKAR